jgi:hypothetical protein
MSSFLNDIDFYDNNKNQLKINKKLIDEIEKYFFKINSIVNNQEIFHYFVKINTSFDNIFKSLIKQTKDSNLIHFIKELSSLSSLYLNNLENYYKSRNIKSIQKNELHEKKYFFSKLDKKITSKILKISGPIIDTLEKNHKLGKLTRSDLSINSGKTIKKIVKILNMEFKRKEILSKISNYMQKDYIIIGCALELSVSNSSWWKNETQKKPSKTWYAHVDESFLYPKAICYLSDVNNENGPTTFYPGSFELININLVQNILGRFAHEVGSSQSSKLYKLINNKNGNIAMNCPNYKYYFSKLPNCLKFNSHFGWHVNSGSKLEKLLCKKEILMTGKKGTFAVFDGANLLHRGGLLKKNKRLSLQIVFGPKLNILQKILNKLKNYY